MAQALRSESPVIILSSDTSDEVQIVDCWGDEDDVPLFSQIKEQGEVVGGHTGCSQQMEEILLQGEMVAGTGDDTDSDTDLDRATQKLKEKVRQGTYCLDQTRVVLHPHWAEEHPSCVETIKDKRIRLQTDSTLAMNEVRWKWLEPKRPFPGSWLHEGRLEIDEHSSVVRVRHVPYRVYVWDACDFLHQPSCFHLEQSFDNAIQTAGCSVLLACIGFHAYIRSHMSRILTQAVRGQDAAMDHILFRSLAEVNAYFVKLYYKHDGKFRFRHFKRNEQIDDFLIRMTLAQAQKPYEVAISAVHCMVRKKGSRVRGTEEYAEWMNFLLQIPQVSEAKAEAIVQAYPNFASLFQAYHACSSDTERAMLLTDVSFGSRGAFIGHIVSSAVYHSVFC